MYNIDELDFYSNPNTQIIFFSQIKWRSNNRSCENLPDLTVNLKHVKQFLSIKLPFDQGLIKSLLWPVQHFIFLAVIEG